MDTEEYFNTEYINDIVKSKKDVIYIKDARVRYSIIGELLVVQVSSNTIPNILDIVKYIADNSGYLLVSDTPLYYRDIINFKYLVQVKVPKYRNILHKLLLIMMFKATYSLVAQERERSISNSDWRSLQYEVVDRHTKILKVIITAEYQVIGKIFAS